jgi:hypothetical protein
MGYGSLQHSDLYDAIYLHTHPRDKRVIPNSISDYIHAETFRIVSTLLVGNGTLIEFESIGQNKSGVDRFEVDGAGLVLPMGGGGFASSSDISHTSPADTARPLGY